MYARATRKRNKKKKEMRNYMHSAVIPLLRMGFGLMETEPDVFQRG